MRFSVEIRLNEHATLQSLVGAIDSLSSSDVINQPYSYLGNALWETKALLEALGFGARPNVPKVLVVEV